MPLPWIASAPPAASVTSYSMVFWSSPRPSTRSATRSPGAQPALVLGSAHLGDAAVVERAAREDVAGAQARVARRVLAHLFEAEVLQVGRGLGEDLAAELDAALEREPAAVVDKIRRPILPQPEGLAARLIDGCRV
jgi:hypothetical protein